MDDKKIFNNIPKEQRLYLNNNDFYLTEKDFYPPLDDRTWKSNIDDIDGGDNFADYCEDFFELLDEEECYEN